MWSIVSLGLGFGIIIECINWIRGLFQLPSLGMHLPARTPDFTEFRFMAHQFHSESHSASTESMRQKYPCVSGTYAIEGPIGIMATRLGWFVYWLGMGSPVRDLCVSSYEAKRNHAYYNIYFLQLG